MVSLIFQGNLIQTQENLIQTQKKFVVEYLSQFRYFKDSENGKLGNILQCYSNETVLTSIYSTRCGVQKALILPFFKWSKRKLNCKGIVHFAWRTLQGVTHLEKSQDVMRSCPVNSPDWIIMQHNLTIGKIHISVNFIVM